MASVQERPATRTVSRCTARKVQGSHAFEIEDYSLHRGLGKGKFISSAAFDVGGYSWCIEYYPDGGYNSEESNGNISVFLKLLTQKVKVRARYDLKLLDQGTGLWFLVCHQVEPSMFNTMEADQNKCSSWGRYDFINRSKLESSAYLQGDRLVIQCDITVVKETKVLLLEGQKVQVPPSNLSHNFGKLLETGEASDVTFSVEGEVFQAHKIVLAVRSPVFKAEFYGQVGKDNREFITIEDMQPAIFKALLHFIYTDSMPSIEDCDGDEKKELVKHLLVAADRYAMDRLKLICEQVLCNHVDVGSVATMLVLADQLNCRNLKDACVKYMVQSIPQRVENSVASSNSLKPKRSFVALVLDKWKDTSFRSSRK